MIVRPSRRSADRLAFTLMEVLVVVAILVILAGVGGVIYLRILEEQRVETAKLNISSIEKVVETYKVKNHEYPATLEVLTQPQDGLPAYIEEKVLIDPWNHEYIYEPTNLNPVTGKPHIYTTNPNNNEQVGNW